MARTIDRLATEHLGELHKAAAFLGFQVNAAWHQARYADGHATTPTTPLAEALYAAADGIKTAETMILAAMVAVAEATSR